VRLVPRIERTEDERRVELTRADEVLLRFVDLRGLPPSIPFRLDDAAFLADLTDPRHAGQNETRSILWT
jgi:hypothetical protein